MESKTTDKRGITVLHSVLLSGEKGVTYSQSARNSAHSADSITYATASAVTITDNYSGSELFSLSHV